MRRGEVWVANLNPPRGREIGKVRLVAVIQCDELGTAVTPMVVCLPLTTKVYAGFSRWRVTLSARDRLLKPNIGDQLLDRGSKNRGSQRIGGHRIGGHKGLEVTG
jgi:mRNA-degrading endonuclease toxin of MazEF toxin-antitoxin module